MLDPFQPARRKIGRRTQAWLLLEHFERNVADLEREAWLTIRPAADRKDLATDFPDMRPPPLNHVSCRREGAAEFVELFVCHERCSTVCLRTPSSCRA